MKHLKVIVFLSFSILVLSAMLFYAGCSNTDKPVGPSDEYNKGVEILATSDIGHSTLSISSPPPPDGAKTISGLEKTAAATIKVWGTDGTMRIITKNDTKVRCHVKFSNASTTNTWTYHRVYVNGTRYDSGWKKRGATSGTYYYDFTGLSLKNGDDTDFHGWLWDNGTQSYQNAVNYTVGNICINFVQDDTHNNNDYRMTVINKIAQYIDGENSVVSYNWGSNSWNSSGATDGGDGSIDCVDMVDELKDDREDDNVPYVPYYVSIHGFGTNPPGNDTHGNGGMSHGQPSYTDILVSYTDRLPMSPYSSAASIALHEICHNLGAEQHNEDHTCVMSTTGVKNGVTKICDRCASQIEAELGL
jgi:hypothetical protein